MSIVVEHLPKSGNTKLTMGRHAIGVGGGLTSVQNSLYLLHIHVILIKNLL